MKNKSDKVPPTDIIQSRDVPSHVATLVQNACYDCHSNNTEYPWYNNIQPYAWYLEGHIQNAKNDLNFNEFEKYSAKTQVKKFRHIKKALEENTMPLTSYKILHAEGRISKSERKQIIDWVDEELKTFN